MSWARFESKAPHHPKILALSDGAFRIWFNSICHANEHKTDGILTQKWIKTQRKVKRIEELFDSGLWVKTGDPDNPARVHDFLDYQLSRIEYQELTEKRSRAGKIGGQRSAQAKAQANAEAHASNKFQANLNPSHPIPFPSSTPDIQSNSYTSSISSRAEPEPPPPSSQIVSQSRAEALKGRMTAVVQKSRSVPWIFPETEIRHVAGLLRNGVPQDAIFGAWRAYVASMQDPSKISVFYFVTNFNRWAAEAARQREADRAE